MFLHNLFDPFLNAAKCCHYMFEWTENVNGKKVCTTLIAAPFHRLVRLTCTSANTPLFNGGVLTFVGPA